jgi:hypothetical protein
VGVPSAHREPDRAGLVTVNMDEHHLDIRPSRARLEAIVPQENVTWEIVRGPVRDRLLREYYAYRSP